MKFMYMTHRTIDRLTKSALILMATTLAWGANAQDSTKKETTFYTVVFNEVPDSFNAPLIGLVNMAEGNQKGLQLGVTNINGKNFRGTQIGFTNAIGGKGRGSQIGNVNVARDSFKGAQVGYINIVTDKVKGAQVGFVNAAKKSVDGAQVSYVNVASQGVDGAQVGFVNVSAGKVDGAQVGYVNVATKDTKGAQVGFVNHTNKELTGTQVGYVNVVRKETKGSQIGFVNVAAKPIRGSQVGFINIADSISHGVPVGFLSFVRKGGFYALEASTNELYPANLSFKIGVRKLYTTFNASYNPDFKNEYAFGMGFGTNLSLSKRLYLNPEAIIQNTVNKESQMFVSLATNLGFSITDHWSVVAGPTVVWSHLDNDDKEAVLQKPSFSLYKEKIDARNQIHVGGRFALRYNF
jgi:hypothetical protein